MRHSFRTPTLCFLTIVILSVFSTPPLIPQTASALTASFGQPYHGSLSNGVPFPRQFNGYMLRDEDHTYTTPEVVGAMLDARASEHKHNMVVNIGNGHTLACRLGPGGIEGFFEHHTGCLSAESLNQYLLDFAAGRLTNESVFSSQGHGALCYTQEQLPMDHDDFNFLVTGPRRNMVRQSALKPHFSAPFGDMMLAGCYGMLVAAADHYTNLAEAIRASFAEDGSQARAPWDLPD